MFRGGIRAPTCGLVSIFFKVSTFEDCTVSAGLSFRAAALRIGCTHRAISVAVRGGRIPLLADGSVLPADVDAWHASRRARRGGANRKVSGAAPKPRQPAPEVSTATQPVSVRKEAPAASATAATELAKVCPEACTVAAAIECGASDLAAILLRRTPLETVRAIVDEWTQASRDGWVGGPGKPWAAADEAGWPAPPGGGAWRDHALFSGPAIPETDWPSIEAEAAAWRAANGVEVPR